MRAITFTFFAFGTVIFIYQRYLNDPDEAPMDPVLARFRSATALPRLARARTPADKWSLPSASGDPAPAVIADTGAVSTARNPPDLAVAPFPGWITGIQRAVGCDG